MDTETPTAASLKTGEILNLNVPFGALGLDLNDDASKLLLACIDGGVYEVSPPDAAVREIARHSSFASGVSHLPHLGQIISAGYDGILKWSDDTTGRLIRTVRAHSFWSWQMALSPDHELIASVSGQYLCGGLKYEPRDNGEPTVKVYSTANGQPVHEFNLTGPVQSVAFSSDGRFLAAANLMGDIRVWDLEDHKLVTEWNSESFTSWGIIKSHCYIGGVYSLLFINDDRDIIACGMGPMRDPMAGNGKQTWERFQWRKSPVEKVDAIHEGDHGGGLPETLALHPEKHCFVMSGRLAQGNWNTGFFNIATGDLIHSLDVKNRITQARFSADGRKLVLAGAAGQGRNDQGKFHDFGRVAIMEILS